METNETLKDFFQYVDNRLSDIENILIVHDIRNNVLIARKLLADVFGAKAAFCLLVTKDLYIRNNVNCRELELLWRGYTLCAYSYVKQSFTYVDKAGVFSKIFESAIKDFLFT